MSTLGGFDGGLGGERRAAHPGTSVRGERPWREIPKSCVGSLSTWPVTREVDGPVDLCWPRFAFDRAAEEIQDLRRPCSPRVQKSLSSAGQSKANWLEQVKE